MGFEDYTNLCNVRLPEKGFKQFSLQLKRQYIKKGIAKINQETKYNTTKSLKSYECH